MTLRRVGGGGGSHGDVTCGKKNCEQPLIRSCHMVVSSRPFGYHYLTSAVK